MEGPLIYRDLCSSIIKITYRRGLTSQILPSSLVFLSHGCNSVGQFSGAIPCTTSDGNECILLFGQFQYLNNSVVGNIIIFDTARNTWIRFSQGNNFILIDKPKESVLCSYTMHIWILQIRTIISICVVWIYFCGKIRKTHTHQLSSAISRAWLVVLFLLHFLHAWIYFKTKVENW